MNDVTVEGWTLNISRGGARILLLDAQIAEGAMGHLKIDGEEPDLRPIRVIWVRSQGEDLITGIQFLDTEGSVPPPDP